VADAETAEWESDLARWDASLPVLLGPEAELVAADASAEALFVAGPASDTASDEARAPFGWQPSPGLVEMTEAAWRDGVHRWLEPPPAADTAAAWRGPAARVAAPDQAAWTALARLLADERACAAPGARVFDLRLAAARVAERLGDVAGAEAEVVAALDAPGVTSSSAQASAAHRALLCLAERHGRAGDLQAQESLQRLALAAHPDQAVYRVLWAEWTLWRAAQGASDGAASASVATIPEGLARALAEAELVWSRPATASAVLETAAHRVGGGLGAGLLTVAAALTEHVGDVGAAAEQRFAAARMVGTMDAVGAEPSAPAHPDLHPCLPPDLGLIRDIARLDPRVGLALLPLLMGRLPPSELKVAIARWGGRLALEAGEPVRAASLLFAPDAELGPSSTVLERARLEALAAGLSPPRPAGEGGAPDDPRRGPRREAIEADHHTPGDHDHDHDRDRHNGDDDDHDDAGVSLVLARSVRALATAWPGPETAVCLAWSVGLWAADRPAIRGPLVRPLMTELVGSAPSTAPGPRWLPLAAAFEALARAAAADSAASTWSLDLWAAVDPARRGSAWALQVATLLARGSGVDALFEALPDHDPELLEGTTLAWQASARASARGDVARAAEWLAVAASASPPTSRLPADHTASTSSFKRALGELARERSERAGPPGSAEPATLTPGGAGGSQAVGAPSVEAASSSAGAELAAWLMAGGWPTGIGSSNQAPAEPDAGVGAGLWPNQPGPVGFWSVFAATWVVLEATGPGELARAEALAGAALADPTAGDSAARVLRRLRRRRLSRPDPSGPPVPRVSADQALEAERRAHVEGSAPAWLEAAEAHEELGNSVRAAELFGVAAGEPDAATVAADLQFGAFRCDGARRLWPTVTPGPSDALVPLTDAERALIDLETLDRAIADGRLEDALGLLVDAPPHEHAPTAETWAFAAELAQAFVPGKPELAARLWSRAEDLALRPGLPSPAEDEPRSPLGKALPALFRLSDPGRATEDVRRSRAQELLAEHARDEPPGDPASAALFSWMGAAAGWTDATDSVALERRLRRSLRLANAVSPEEGGPPAPVVMAWRRWLASSGRPREAALAAAAEAEALRVPRHRVEALLRAVDLETELEQRRARGPGGSGPRDDGGGDAAGGNRLPAERSPDPERSPRTRDWLREVLRIAPDHLAAFERLGKLYGAEGRHREWSEVLAERLAATQNPFERTSLRLARAECLAGALGDLAGARRELELVLEREPQHPVALGRLVALEEAASNLKVVPDLLRRLAAVEPTDEIRLQVFVKLGRVLLAGPTPDLAAAAAAFEQALDLFPGDRDALEALSRLRLELGRIEPGLAVTRRLLEQTDGPHARARLLARVGRYLGRAGDPRGAQLAYRQALTTCPTELGPLDELLRLLDRVPDARHDARGHEVIAGRFVLDEVAHRLREALTGASAAGAPGALQDEAAVARALASVLGRRGRSAAAEALLEWGAWRAARAGTRAGLPLDWGGIFGIRPPPLPTTPPTTTTQPTTQPTTHAATTAGQPARDRENVALRRLGALLDPSREELLFPATVPPAFRRLCRALGPLILEEGGPALEERAERLGQGRAGRAPMSKVAHAIWDELAAVMTPGPFELHLVRSSSPREPIERTGEGFSIGPAEVLPGKIWRVVAGADRLSLGGPPLVGDGPATPAQRAALRFAGGHTLFLARSGLGFALVGPPALLAAWLTALIRPFVPDHLHPAADPEEAERWTARFARHLSRKARHELAPFALECATALPVQPLRAGILEAANRAGLVASGSMAVCAELLTPSDLGPAPERAALLAFAASDDLDPLVAELRP
jgi:tetratricopeptide (TPR) repeat protein